MSFFGVDLRNAVAVGLGGIASMFSGSGAGTDKALDYLLTESDDFLVQEDGSLIILE